MSNFRLRETTPQAAGQTWVARIVAQFRNNWGLQTVKFPGLGPTNVQCEASRFGTYKHSAVRESSQAVSPNAPKRVMPSPSGSSVNDLPRDFHVISSAMFISNRRALSDTSVLFKHDIVDSFIHQSGGAVLVPFSQSCQPLFQSKRLTSLSNSFSLPDQWLSCLDCRTRSNVGPAQLQHFFCLLFPHPPVKTIQNHPNT